VARAWLAACACVIAACSPRDSGAVPRDGSGPAPAEPQNVQAGATELIPAEWTIAEDTSATGEVTTVSLQLPSARDIGGLLHEEAPRFMLRCLNGRVQAYIDTESLEAEPDSAVVAGRLVQVQLDSAPTCE
jgi:hypothetical protein